MLKFIFTAVIAMTFGTLVIAQSTIPLERELHVVIHYEGRDKTNGQPHGPISDIEIDRPNKAVTLVLGAHSPIRWTVSVSDATQIEKVVLFGRSARKSEILLTGGNLDTYSILPDI